MTKDLAIAIVAAWKRDGVVCDVPGLIDSFNAQGKYAPALIRLQVFVGSGNRLASSALWDGKFNLAVALLMKHDLKDRSTIARGKPVKTTMGSRRLSGDVRNPKSDWKYVK